MTDLMLDAYGPDSSKEIRLKLQEERLKILSDDEFMPSEVLSRSKRSSHKKRTLSNVGDCFINSRLIRRLSMLWRMHARNISL